MGFFKLNDDIDEFRSETGWGKVFQASKIVAKSAVNVGTFVAKELPVAAAQATLKNENASDEAKERARNFLDKYQK